MGREKISENGCERAMPVPRTGTTIVMKKSVAAVQSAAQGRFCQPVDNYAGFVFYFSKEPPRRRFATPTGADEKALRAAAII